MPLARSLLHSLVLVFLALASGIAAAAPAQDYVRKMTAAEAALAQRAPAAALQLFQQAAALDDATPDAELGMVRAYLQGGEYRQALAFAGLVAGEHVAQRADPRAQGGVRLVHEGQAVALLAWLQYLGGRRQQAVQALDIAQAEQPPATRSARERAALRAVAARMRDEPLADASPLRLDPYAEDIPGATALATGIVLPDGVLAPADALRGANGKLWVRNALGEVRGATVVRVDDGLARLRLAAPFSAPAHVPSAAQGAIGSPAYLVTQAASVAPRWPLLRAGFLARAGDGTQTLVLDGALNEAAASGVVFDAYGHLLGFARASASGSPRIVQVVAADDADGIPATTAVTRMTVEAVYEQALPALVTVLRTAR